MPPVGAQAPGIRTGAELADAKNRPGRFFEIPLSRLSDAHRALPIAPR